MKRRILVVSALICLMLSLTSCSETKASSLLEVKALSCCNLCSYEDLAEIIDIEDLTESDLDTIIMIHLSYNNIYKSIEDRNSPQDEDIAYISMNISAEDGYRTKIEQYYIAGSGEISQEFDNLLQEMLIGETKSTTIQFPDEYYDYQLAGLSCNIELTLKGLYTFIEIDDEELILDYYECSSMKDVYAKVRQEAKEKSIIDQAEEYILENSTVTKMPKYLEQYIEDNVISPLRQEAENNNTDVYTFCNEAIGMDYTEYIDGIYSDFTGFVIMKALTEKEGISFDSSSYSDYVMQQAELNNVSEDEVVDYYGEFGIYNNMVFEAADDIILAYYYKREIS